METERNRSCKTGFNKISPVDKAYVVLNENDEKVVKSARNLPNVQTALTNTINVYDVMKGGTVILTKDAVKTIEEVYA